MDWDPLSLQSAGEPDDPLRDAEWAAFRREMDSRVPLAVAASIVVWNAAEALVRFAVRAARTPLRRAAASRPARALEPVAVAQAPIAAHFARLVPDADLETLVAAAAGGDGGPSLVVATDLPRSEL